MSILENVLSQNDTNHNQISFKHKKKKKNYDQTIITIIFIAFTYIYFPCLSRESIMINDYDKKLKIFQTTYLTWANAICFSIYRTRL